MYREYGFTASVESWRSGSLRDASRRGPADHHKLFNPAIPRRSPSARTTGNHYGSEDEATMVSQRGFPEIRDVRNSSNRWGK